MSEAEWSMGCRVRRPIGQPNGSLSVRPFEEEQPAESNAWARHSVTAYPEPMPGGKRVLSCQSLFSRTVGRRERYGCGRNIS